MTRQFSPRPYQRMIIDHILNTPRCAIWADMGTGKTVSTLTALDTLSVLDGRPALVIAPLRVAATTWPTEARKWEHLRSMKVVPVVGSAAQRKAALDTPANVYCINYDNLPWLISQFPKDAWPFGTIVADEATRLKGFRHSQGSVRARALAKVAHKYADRFIALTGTPAPNGLQDLWGQNWFIDAGRRLGSSFSAFTARWFRQVQVGQDRFAVKLEPHSFAATQIEELLKDVTLRVDAADWFGIAQPIMQTVKVQLPAKAMSQYETLREEMLLELSNKVEIEAFNAASLTMKCLQLANGALYVDDSNAYEVLHNAKIDALKSIVEEAAGSPVLVAYHFKSDLERLLKAFPEGRPLDKDPQTIAAWNAGKIPVLFAHPASAGHGLNLQDGGHHLAFFGHWWDLEQYQQIIERIGPVRQAQAGHKRPVYIYHIVAEKTVDEQVMVRRTTKRAVQDILLENMK